MAEHHVSSGVSWSEDCVCQAASRWALETCLAPCRPAVHLVAAKALARDQTQSSGHDRTLTLRRAETDTVRETMGAVATTAPPPGGTHGIPIRAAPGPLRRGRRRDARSGTGAPAAGAGALRSLRPHLPLALRGALQLRPAVGPPRRLHLVRPLRGRRCSSTRWTTTSASPDRDDADIISYAAGHKALGLYAMWALRNELLRIGAPDLLPRDEQRQLRLEDLLGFRRNPVQPHPAVPEVQGQGARRPSHAGHAVRPALDRRLGRGPGGLAGPGLRRARLLRRGRAARAHRRGRGRHDARPRRRGAGRRRHRLARQRRAPRGLEPGLDRLEPRLPRRREARRLRAVDAGGAGLPARLERRSSCPTARTSSR